jgi:hypothetical protein
MLLFATADAVDNALASSVYVLMFAILEPVAKADEFIACVARGNRL